MSRTAWTLGWICSALAVAGSVASGLAAQMEESGRLRGHITKASSIAFSTDGRIAVSGGGGQTDFLGLGPAVWVDCTAWLWDVSRGQAIRKFEGHAEPVTCVELSADNQRLLTASSDNTVRIWNVATGQPVHRFNGVLGTFSPDGRRMAVALQEGAIDLFDAGTGQRVMRMVGHHNGTTSMAFSGDGQMLVSGGNDEAVRVWSLRTGKALQTLRLPGNQIPLRVGVLPGDGQMVGVSDRTCVTWDLPSGRQIRSFRIDQQEQLPIDVRISADCRCLLCLSPAGELRCYDIETGVLGETISLPKLGQSRCQAMSPDGRTVISATAANTDLVVYRVSPPAGIHPDAGSLKRSN